MRSITGLRGLTRGLRVGFVAVLCAVPRANPAATLGPPDGLVQEQQGDAPRTGEVWKAEAAKLEVKASWLLEDAADNDEAADFKRRDAERLDEDARQERTAGRNQQAGETAERARAARTVAADLETRAREQRENAWRVWLERQDALDKAADSFENAGKVEEAARCLVSGAESAEGFPSKLIFPGGKELRPHLLELQSPATATDDTARAERLEGAARRLLRAADLLDAAGRRDEAHQRRGEADTMRDKASKARQRASTPGSAGPQASAGKDESLRRDYLDAEREHLVTWNGPLVTDAIGFGELLAPDLNFPSIGAPEVLTQKMIVDGVARELRPTPVLVDRLPFDPRAPWRGPRVLFASFSPTAEPGDPETPAAPGFKVFFSSLGTSTGEAFEAHIVGAGPPPERLSFNGLVIEPLAKDARRAIERQVGKLAGGRRATARVDAYCVEFLRLPPVKDLVFQVADAGAQRRLGPMRRILNASRRLQQAGVLSPDSEPTSYFHSIRQWALWTSERRFDERAYADAFVTHTRKNLEATGRKWKREMEQLLRRAASSRWRDIQRILAEAAASPRPAPAP